MIVNVRIFPSNIHGSPQTRRVALRARFSKACPGAPEEIDPDERQDPLLTTIIIAFTSFCWTRRLEKNVEAAVQIGIGIHPSHVFTLA